MGVQNRIRAWSHLCGLPQTRVRCTNRFIYANIGPTRLLDTKQQSFTWVIELYQIKEQDNLRHKKFIRPMYGMLERQFSIHRELPSHLQGLGYIHSLISSECMNLLQHQSVLENAWRRQSVHTKTQRLCWKFFTHANNVWHCAKFSRVVVGALCFPANSSATFIMEDNTPIDSIDCSMGKLPYEITCKHYS